MSQVERRQVRSSRVSRRSLIKGTVAASIAAPLIGAANGWGPFRSRDKFLAMAQAAPIQFDLVPSGIAALFPGATATVYITPGDTADDVQVVARNLPSNMTFTCYFIQHRTKPFGAAQYCMDLKTDAYGSGTAYFHGITRHAYAMIAESAGTSADQSGSMSGTQLEHFGIWFSSLTDARSVLNNPGLTGTPFDGGSPPAHAGPQAMNDGSDAPKFTGVPTVPAPSARTPVPSAPTNLQATALDSTDLRLTWTNNATNADSILIYDATENQQIATADGAATSTVLSVSPGGHYCAYIYAYNSAGYSGASNVTCADTPP